MLGVDCVHVLGVVRDDESLTLTVETDATLAGCPRTVHDSSPTGGTTR